MFPIAFDIGMPFASVVPMAAVMNVSSAAPNPVVTNPYAIRIWRCTRIVDNLCRLGGYIIFPGTRYQEQGAD